MDASHKLCTMKSCQRILILLIIPMLAFGQRGDWVISPQFGYGITSPLLSSTIYSRDEIPRNKPYYSFGVMVGREKYDGKRNWTVGVNYVQKSYVDISGVVSRIIVNGQLIRVSDTLTFTITHQYLDFPIHLNIPLYKRTLSLRTGVNIGFLVNGGVVGRSIRTGKVIETQELGYRGTDSVLPRFGTFYLGILYTKTGKHLGIGVEPFLAFEAPSIFATVGIRRTYGMHQGNLMSGIKVHVPITLTRAKSFYSPE